MGFCGGKHGFWVFTKKHNGFVGFYRETMMGLSVFTGSEKDKQPMFSSVKTQKPLVSPVKIHNKPWFE